MELKNYKKRLVDDKLELYLKTFSAILIEGPKWCGKTWSSVHNSKSTFFVADPKENFNNRYLATLDPNLILDGKIPRLIDERQEVPSIWDAVRGRVDLDPRKGQFILTGSTSINKNSYIHSGTGRIARLKMRTMSLYESGYSNGKISLKDICYNNINNIYTGEVSLNKLLEYIIGGGFPGAIGLTLEQSRLISKNYVEAIISEDIYKLDNIKRDMHKIELLLKSLARNESTTVTNKTLQKDIKDKDFDDIGIDTIGEYLNLFNRLYIIENIPPYSSNLRSSLRLKQSEKRHFVDPSLPCALLNITKEKLLNDLNFTGFLFESLVIRDLLTYVSSFDAKLFHYQDYCGNEIDALIELKDGDYISVEIKLGAHQIEEAAKNLIKINNETIKKGGKGAKSLIVICGLTNAAYRRDDGVIVVPITSLKD